MSFIHKFLTHIFRRYTAELGLGEQDLSALQAAGLKLGTGGYIGPGCVFDPSHAFLIEIGNDVVFSTRVRLIAHDASTRPATGYTKIGRILIGDRCFIGSDTTVLCGVTIGADCLVGASSVVTKDLPPGGVYAGSPAKFICSLEAYNQRNAELLETSPKFDASYLIDNITPEKKQEMLAALSDGVGFIV
ncbi:MAG: acyltransferase [Oscillospiraceae bacterium]|jgi:maltose O-acetyltransferase|nr:acyltransferase [Oscillospiraceae bacterium]